MSISRRSFLKLSSYFGLSISNGYAVFSGANKGQYERWVMEQQKKRSLARYIFNFSSPYPTESFKSTPHSHQVIKELVERYTQNKVYVQIHDSGSQGVGSTLSNSVSYGASQGALLSVANLASKVPELDILNIPFWCAESARYLRLFNSSVWQKHVLAKTEKSNIKVLFPYVVGARTATSTRLYGKTIKDPADFKDVRFRIPGSESLKIFYELAGAKPVSIMWDLAARTARKDRYQALDPSIVGLYSGPDNLKNEIGTISNIESVHDGWVAIANTHFLQSMDEVTRKQFLTAFEEVQQIQQQMYHQSQQYCSQQFIQSGVSIYQPSVKEKQHLADAFGHHQTIWEPLKKRLLGDNGLALFDNMYRIAQG